MAKINPAQRHKARKFALQVLYQWQLTKNDCEQIQAQTLAVNNFAKIDKDYFLELTILIPERVNELDEFFSPYLDRPIDEVSPIELAILRMGSYELQFRPEIPYRVVLNEAIELAKEFGQEQSHKYINGVLDQVAQQLRATELQQATGNKKTSEKD